MRFAFLRRAGVSATIVALIAACGAATGEDLVMPEPDGGLVPNDGSIGPDVSAQDGALHQDSASPDAGPACIANCTFDLQCQMTCPPAPVNGVNCCDVASGVCYAAATRMCGVPMGDASLD